MRAREKNNRRMIASNGADDTSVDNAICTVSASVIVQPDHTEVIQRPLQAQRQHTIMFISVDIVARYLLERPLLPSSLPHSWDFRSASGSTRKSVGINSILESIQSRWSRHIGQYCSTVSFLHFYPCTLLPFYFFSLFYFFCSGTLNTILFM